MNPNPIPFRPGPFPTTQNSFTHKPIPSTNQHPRTASPSIRTHKINYMNKPNFHVEEVYGYDYNYQYPEYDQYYDEQQPPYAESTESDVNTHAIETHELTTDNSENATNQTEQQTIDDLNFQLAHEATGMT